MMAEHQLNASLMIENEKLRCEVEDLKTLQSVVKENLELRSRLDSFSFTNQTLMEKSEMNAGKKPSFQYGDSVLEESSFRAGLITPHHTSSPLKSTQRRSAHPDTLSSVTFSSCNALEGPERLLGEIAFQLERRILSHVFYKQTRLYGFTVQNLQDKILQVSTHPLTGQVDKSYRSELTERYIDIMDRLATLGYNMSLHPPFSEFIINTYGILKNRPDTHTAQENDYNNLVVLQGVMVETAPSALLKDLLVLLSCLCYLSEKDGKSLILW
ncbi:speriolin-like protein [Silurus meridionalis]|uniref:Speriolin C-terminal domain-containing protein n=1 Tax=Silurus meridionalis TaxID=175797 RepID=A0A8T0AKD0_SILME|nr:speriolin-like protein [Silurus meridionalis]KAF7692073.1 hypothetical protein HF521_011040 [Silurus meridionalis]